MKPHPDNLIWLDCEMTGLEPDQHVILEVGCAVTDGQLQSIEEGPCLAIHQPDLVLARMEPWSIEHHGRSGLTEKCRRSETTLSQAEQQLLAFLRLHCLPGQSPLCGNSISQDRRFLIRFMPELNRFFHYRNVDVSSIKELARRWYPPALRAPEKVKTHTVLEDIRESIAELRHYRQHIFRPLQGL